MTESEEFLFDEQKEKSVPSAVYCRALMLQYYSMGIRKWKIVQSLFA